MQWKPALLFTAAYILDLILGDPVEWPHPVRWIGYNCQFWEKILYSPGVWAGLFFWMVVMGTIMALITVLLHVLSLFSAPAAIAMEIYLMYACLATRSLHRESQQVEKALIQEDLGMARERLSFIVSRDTTHLSTEEVRRATIETVAENLSDGVIAPVFYGVLLGMPGMLAYKGVNTLDSMVGYRNERYSAFGTPAARIDDVLNWLPSRISALLVVCVAHLLRLDGPGAWRIVRRDAQNAAGPNAGWPEAAMAGALGIRLGGPSSYFGKMVEKSFIGDPIHPIGHDDYTKAVHILYGTSILTAALAFGLLLWIGTGTWGILYDYNQN